MSTKCSLAYGRDQFHLYHECFEEDEAVYLELRGEDVQYVAEAERVTIRVPVEVWEVIRTRGAAETGMADLSDAEIEARAAAEADRGVAEYREAAASGNEGLVALQRIWGHDRPRDEQIAERRRWHEEERARHRERRARIQELERQQR